MLRRLVAVLGGAEAPCANFYACDAYAGADTKGLPRSVRTLSFAGSSPVTELLFRGTPSSPAKPFVAAVASTSEASRGFAMFRLDSELHGVWLDANGKKDGAPFLVGRATDVGAPAVAFVGQHAYTSWAARASAHDPYKLYIAQVGSAATLWTRELDVGQGSENVFAPALSPAAGRLALAWTNGDGGSKGRIQLGFLPLSSLIAAATPLPVADRTAVSEVGNHRDAELASAGEELYVAWSDFTKRKAEGVSMLQKQHCPEP